jgi:hypothetical protein
MNSEEGYSDYEKASPQENGGTRRRLKRLTRKESNGESSPAQQDTQIQENYKRPVVVSTHIHHTIY